jgi:hypothetical protein
LAAFAAPFGVRVVAAFEPSGAGIVDLPWGNPAAIAAAAVARPGRFRLVAPPAATCTQPMLAWCLAIAAERAAGGGALPLASLWVRLRSLVH